MNEEIAGEDVGQRVGASGVRRHSNPPSSPSPAGDAPPPFHRQTLFSNKKVGSARGQVSTLSIRTGVDPRLRPSPARIARGRGPTRRRIPMPASACAVVVLALAERFAPAFGDAEIELLDVLVLAQAPRPRRRARPGRSRGCSRSGISQRHVGVLLGEQERHALPGVQVAARSRRSPRRSAARAPSTARRAGSSSGRDISARPIAHICCSPPEV